MGAKGEVSDASARYGGDNDGAVEEQLIVCLVRYVITQLLDYFAFRACLFGGGRTQSGGICSARALVELA